MDGHRPADINRLRVSKAANLSCWNLKIGYGDNKIFIHEGKGSISGHIIIHEALEEAFEATLGYGDAGLFEPN
jgi:hypothetical protein